MNAEHRNLAFLFYLVIFVISITSSVSSSSAQVIQVIQTRPGVSMPFLLHCPAAAPKGVMVIFPGGDGSRMFRQEGGEIRLGKNFLVRTSPAFVKAGYAVAIVDVPSDRPSGMPPAFRNSPQHVQDIARLIDFLDARGLKPIYLVGTSMGTLSAAYLGMELKDSRVTGIVLTSTVTSYVGGLRLHQITSPVLLVHHRDDGCKHCPFSEALQLRNKISGRIKVDFVEVQGGDPPQSDPCQPLSPHGFFGVEDLVAQVIANWAAGKSIPLKIGR